MFKTIFMKRSVAASLFSLLLLVATALFGLTVHNQKAPTVSAHGATKAYAACSNSFDEIDALSKQSQFLSKHAQSLCGNVTNAAKATATTTPQLVKNSTLVAVSAVDANDVWTVGSKNEFSDNPQLPWKGIVQHWNGQKWSFVEVPQPGVHSDFVGVAAFSKTNVWIVGAYTLADTTSKTLVEHWDGHIWNIVASPSPLATNSLISLSASSKNDIWAVGTSYDAATKLSRTLVIHWDGSKWSLSPGLNPSSTGKNLLNDVSAISPNDVWIVGVTRVSGTTNEASFAQHWNGHQWQLSTVPTISTSTSDPTGELNGVAILAKNDVVAVGNFDRNKIGTPLTERWQGKDWQSVNNSFSSTEGPFTEVRKIPGTRQAWAVGFKGIQTENGNTVNTLVGLWDGAGWKAVDSPNANLNGDLGSALTGVTALSPKDAWAVGDYDHEDNANPSASVSFKRPLIEHWDGAKWTIVPSPYI